MNKYNRLPYYRIAIAGLLSAGLLAFSTAPARDINVELDPEVAFQLKEEVPLRYVVKKGDTLWDIAAKFLKDPWYWPELWFVNSDIRDPHLIYPGDVLYLILRDGRPVLTLDEQSLTKVVPEVRAEALERAIPTIPLDAIRQFLNGPRVVSEEELEGAPYIVQFLEEHILGAEGIAVYLRRVNPDQGRDYQVVRQGQAYIDPETEELLGYEAIPTGEVRVTDFADVSGGYLTSSSREVQIGERLLKRDDSLLIANFFPRAPERDIEAFIISVFGGVSQVAQYQIVALNKGSQDGLERGHVLSIFQAGQTVPDPHGEGVNPTVDLPDAYAGILMVFQVGERVSHALVMEAQRAIHILDKARTPQP